jgi:hypothetical protein
MSAAWRRCEEKFIMAGGTSAAWAILKRHFMKASPRLSRMDYFIRGALGRARRNRDCQFFDLHSC